MSGLGRRWCVALVVVAGCGPTSVYSRSDTAGLPSTRQDVEEHEWVLDRGDSSLTVDDDNPVTLAVHDDEVSGAAPCNAYRGSFELDDDDKVDITDIALTRRSCEPETMRAEDEVVGALEAVDHASVDHDDHGDADRLVLDDGSDVRLAFDAYDADELIAGTWDVVAVAIGDSIDSVAPGRRPTLTFDDDGTLTLDTGCATVTSSWELDGDALDIDPLRLPDEACGEAALAVALALDAVHRVDIAPGELLLLDAADAILLVATEAR